MFLKNIKSIALTVAIALFSLSSCQVQTDDIRLEGVEDFQIEGVTFSQARLRVTAVLVNDSRMKIVLKEAEFTVSDERGEIVDILLGNELFFPKRSTTIAEIPITVKFKGGLGALSAVPRLNGELNRITVTGRVRVKGGAINKTFTFQDMPLAQFARIMQIDDLKSLNLSF